MLAKNFISADDFRVPKEKMMLFGSLGVLAFILIIALKISIYFIAIIIGISVAWVKIRQGQLLGQCVKVSEDQLTEVYKASQIASNKLCMRMPDVFVKQDPIINAFALGFLGKTSVVLHSATVESMDTEELISVLGHEFSHIKCHHTTWTVITSSTGSIKVPIISDIMGFIFLLWSRKAEYTCDRGGLIACENLKASVAGLAKVAVGNNLYKKLNIEKLLDQIKDIEQDRISSLSELLSTHPYIFKRIHALIIYYESREYKKLTSMDEVTELQEEVKKLREEKEKLKAEDITV